MRAPAAPDPGPDRGPAVLPFPASAVRGPARASAAPPALYLVVLSLDTWDIPAALHDTPEAAFDAGHAVASDPAPAARRWAKACGLDPDRLAGHRVGHVAVVEFRGPHPAGRSLVHLFPAGEVLAL